MKKYLFMAVTALAILGAQLLISPAESEVGLLSTKYYNYAYEIAETLTVLDGSASGVTYSYRVPGGAAFIKLSVHLNGTWAAGGADAYFQVTMKNRYGSYTDVSGNNDIPVVYDNKSDGTATEGAIYICDDSTGAVGASEEVIKDYILGTHGTWIVIADSIHILVRASTGSGDWTTDAEDYLKLWVEMLPYDLRIPPVIGDTY